MAAKQPRGAYRIECPYCGAPPGERCRRSAGSPFARRAGATLTVPEAHSARREAWAAQRDDPAPAESVRRDTDGTILHGMSLPCGCPLDADCTGYHPGALS